MPNRESKPVGVVNTNAPDEFLTSYVQALSRMGMAFAQVLERAGRVRHSVLPQGIRKMQRGQCYRNAGTLHLERPHWTYCEGLACPEGLGVPMGHAWLLDENGQVVDPTWGQGGAYLGVPFESAYCTQMWADTGYWGLWAEMPPADVFRLPVWEVLSLRWMQDQKLGMESLWGKFRKLGDRGSRTRRSLRVDAS